MRLFRIDFVSQTLNLKNVVFPFQVTNLQFDRHLLEILNKTVVGQLLNAIQIGQVKLDEFI